MAWFRAVTALGKKLFFSLFVLDLRAAGQTASDQGDDCPL